MLRRRLSVTAVVSSCIIAGGLFWLDVPATKRAPAHSASLPDLSAPVLQPPVSLGSQALASVEVASLEADPVIESAPQVPYEKTLKVASGDTLMNILLKADINRGDAHVAIEALSDLYDPRKIRPGQEIHVTFDPAEDNSGTDLFTRMRLSYDFNSEVHVARDDEGRYKAAKVEKPLVKTLKHAKGTIGSSLWNAVEDAGLPLPVFMKMVNAYSFDIDFQRDIQRGDRFEVLYESVATEDGKSSRAGEMIFARLVLQDVDLPLYLFKDSEGFEKYFNDKGWGAQKALMRTPINGARLSSNYGMRKHPILGYNKMHRGVDFAAPSGTPILAAGDGVIDYAGRKGAYGKYMRIRHNGTYSTAYAHLRAFKKGMHKGKRVKQGDVIGFVGSTGRSTGPHLHYEILKHGKQVNPMKVRMPSGKKLKGKELERFQSARAKIDSQFAELQRASTTVASAD